MKRTSRIQSEGNITITRPSGGDATDNPYISIEVQDNRSRVRFLSLKVNMADFAKAITGFGHTPCRIEVSDLERVAMFKHSTTVWEKYEYDHKEDSEVRKKKIIEKALKDLKKVSDFKDWQYDCDDLGNHNRRTKEGTYAITFCRFSETPPEEKS